MPLSEAVASLRGMYRDVLYDGTGQVTWDGGWRSNAIVTNCHILLAAFVSGKSPTAGITGLWVGAGKDTWDQLPGPPPAQSSDTSLVDPFPYSVPVADLQIDYLIGDVVSATPTSRIQIFAKLGPGTPKWPDPPKHTHGTLREFGLYAMLDGNPVLINHVNHLAIPKDPASTLERTIWLIL